MARDPRLIRRNKSRDSEGLVDAVADEMAILKAFGTWLPSRVQFAPGIDVYCGWHGCPAQDRNVPYLSASPDRSLPIGCAGAAVAAAKVMADIHVTEKHGGQSGNWPVE